MPFIEEYIEKHGKDAFHKRMTVFPDEINDIIDLFNFINMHNLYPTDEDVVNVYKDGIEVYALTTEEPFPWFMDNFFIIEMPRLTDDDDVLLVINMNDYDEEVDQEERLEVMEYLCERIPTILNVDYIQFTLNHEPEWLEVYDVNNCEYV